MENYEIVEVPAALCFEALDTVGFYVVDRDATDTGPLDWRTVNRGNGPEVTQDGVFGPFKNHEAASQWLDDYTAE